MNRIDTYILDGFGEDEFVGDEDDYSGLVYETGCRKGNLFDYALVSFDADCISDFEIVTEDERETSGKVRDSFFAGERKEDSPDSGSCYESSDADTEYSEYEDERDDSNKNSNDTFSKGEYLLGEGVVLEESSKCLGEDEIGDK